MLFAILLVAAVAATIFILFDNRFPLLAGYNEPDSGEWKFASLFEIEELQVNKGAKAPKRDKKAERLSRQLMQAQLKAASQKVAVPEIPVAPEPDPLPPPPSETSSDVVDAEREARKKSKKRTNSGTGTIFAGETGGGNKGLGGSKTLLGGGGY